MKILFILAVLILLLLLPLLNRSKAKKHELKKSERIKPVENDEMFDHLFLHKYMGSTQQYKLHKPITECA